MAGDIFFNMRIGKIVVREKMRIIAKKSKKKIGALKTKIGIVGSVVLVKALYADMIRPFAKRKNG